MTATPVTFLFTRAFEFALSANPGLLEKWVKISCRIGGKLPNSMLSGDVQNLGHLDALLRSLEQERAKGLQQNAPPQVDFGLHFQFYFSALWITGSYEVFRLLKERGVERDNEFNHIHHDLTLLRIPLSKHEIAKDKKIAQPLVLGVLEDNKIVKRHEYFSKDKLKSHIMPQGLTLNGSVTWQALDLKDSTSKWLSRIELSDRIISWATRQEAHLGE